MKDFALSLPDFGEITPPSNVPVGGLFTTGAEIIRLGLTAFLIIIVLLAIFYILWGGIRYTLSRGDREKVQGAREKITYAIVGLVVAFLAFLIIGTTGQFFNVNLIGQIAIGPTLPPIPPCELSGGVCKPTYPCGLGYGPSSLSCGSSNVCCVPAAPTSTPAPTPTGTPVPTSTPAPTPTPTPTPTPAPACTGTPSLSLDTTTVPPGGSFTATVTGMSSGCNTFGANFQIDGSPTGLACGLLASGTCSRSLTAPTIELTYMYRAWVDKNLNGSQDGGEISNTVPLTVLTDTAPPVITLFKVGGDVSPPYQTFALRPIVEFTTNENAWCKFSTADLGYDSMSFNCESGESTISHQCNTSGVIDFLTAGPKNFFLACRDAAFNRHTAVDNYKVDVEIVSLAINNVTGRVWVDSVVNGIYDWQLGEQAYCGATVEAYRDGSLVRNVITDNVGNYFLAGLEDGNYTISLSVPSGYTMPPGTSDIVDIFLTISQAIDFGIVPNVPSPSFPGCIK